MRKILLIILAILIISSGVLGLIYFFPETSLKNCKNDHTCITDALRACVKAKGVSLSNPPRENYIEIRGLADNKCTIYIKNAVS